MDAFLTWLRQDTAGLLTLAGLGIAVLLFLIIKLKVEPFIALVGVGVLEGVGDALGSGAGVPEGRPEEEPVALGVGLPAPVGPTMAIFCPGQISAEKFLMMI